MSDAIYDATFPLWYRLMLLLPQQKRPFLVLAINGIEMPFADWGAFVRDQSSKLVPEERRAEQNAIIDELVRIVRRQGDYPPAWRALRTAAQR